MKKLKFRFEPAGLLLFFVIMLPNIVWFLYPAPEDILRRPSLTPGVDAAAAVCQVFMAAALCVTVDQAPRPAGIRGGWIAGTAVCCGVYFCAWILYYMGETGRAVLGLLCAAPCLAFILFEIGRKNWAALVPTAVFTVLHGIYGIVNFMI